MSFRGGGYQGRGGGNRFGGRGNSGGGGRGRGGNFRGGGGRGGFNRFQHSDEPPEQVLPFAHFTHPCGNDLVLKVDIEDVPYFNAPVYLANKNSIGKIDEIFGPMHNYYVSVKLTEQTKASSFNVDDKFYIDPAKILPLKRFLPQPPGKKSEGKRGGGVGGRGGGFNRGGRNNFGGRGGARGGGFRGGAGNFRGGGGGNRFSRGGNRGGFNRR